MQTWQGSAGIGLLTSRLHVEGPLAKGKTAIIAGARTTYSDWLLKRLPKESAYAGGSAGFTDANLGITHRFDDEQYPPRLRLLGHGPFLLRRRYDLPVQQPERFPRLEAPNGRGTHGRQRRL